MKYNYKTNTPDLYEILLKDIKYLHYFFDDDYNNNFIIMKKDDWYYSMVI